MEGWVPFWPVEMERGASEVKGPAGAKEGSE